MIWPVSLVFNFLLLNDVILVFVSFVFNCFSLLKDIFFLLSDIIVIVGGVIPPKDYDELFKSGCAAIFGPGKCFYYDLFECLLCGSILNWSLRILSAFFVWQQQNKSISRNCWLLPTFFQAVWMNCKCYLFALFMI